MNKRKMVTALLLGMAVLALAGLVTAQMAGIPGKREVSNKTKYQARTAYRSQDALRQQKTPQEEQPTVVQEGVMTEKQKRHSKLFKRYGALTGGKRLKDVSTQTGEVSVAVEVGDRLLPAVTFDLNAHLRNSACKAAAVIVGTVNSKASQLTEDGTFAFTDYDITVEEVLKNNSAAPIAANSTITVTRAGGSVKLQGRTIRAFDHSERPLATNGRFLLFLEYLPDSLTYKPYISDFGDSSFQIHGDKLSQVSGEALPDGASHEVDALSFLSKARSAAYGTCNN